MLDAPELTTNSWPVSEFCAQAAVAGGGEAGVEPMCRSTRGVRGGVECVSL